MSNHNNLEIWKDKEGVINITFWDTMHGKDYYIELFKAGQVYENETPVRDLDYSLFDRLLTHIEESYKDE